MLAEGSAAPPEPQIGDRHGVQRAVPGHVPPGDEGDRTQGQAGVRIGRSRNLEIERHKLSRLNSPRRTPLNLLFLQGRGP
jgi:hypothetical protein